MNKSTFISHRAPIVEIRTEQLATVTGGVDCDGLRGLSGRFKPENQGEVADARACVDAGHPLVKKLF
ncbi:MAG TPA: hypothetical protein VGL61_22845 [Kofleriaceae bacterium]|jgi:hypothetical protein